MIRTQFITIVHSTDTMRKTTNQNHHDLINYSKLFYSYMVCFSLKVGFRRSSLYMGKLGVFYNLGVGGFKMEDLADKQDYRNRISITSCS